LAINHALQEPLHSFKSAFPVPGGGIDRTTVDNWKQLYGDDTIFLIGGSLYQHPEGMRIAVEEFQNSLSD
jgi:ribulose-bisphosphate carboxylase large chain